MANTDDDYGRYLDEMERGPALARFEHQAEQGWLRRAEYAPEALDEMERQDAEGRS